LYKKPSSGDEKKEWEMKHYVKKWLLLWQVIRKAQTECRKIIAILNEGRNVTKLGIELGDEGGLCVRGNH